MDFYSKQELYFARQITLYADDFKYNKLSRRAQDVAHVVAINLDGFDFSSDEADLAIEYLSTNVFYHLQILTLSNTKRVDRLIKHMFREGLRYPSLEEIDMKNVNAKCCCCGRGEDTSEFLPMIQQHFAQDYEFIRESEKISHRYDFPVVFLSLGGFEYDDTSRVTKTSKTYKTYYKNGETADLPLVLVMH